MLPLTPALTIAFSYYCGLFVAAKKLNPFVINQIQTLFAKTPGVGWDPPESRFWNQQHTNSSSVRCLCVASATSASLRYHLPSNLSALCFHILTNCSFRKSFILITIRIARGCGVCALPFLVTRHSPLATSAFRASVVNPILAATPTRAIIPRSIKNGEDT